MSNLVLGVLENAPPWMLTSKYLTHSKVGGKPAWLSFDDIPGSETLKCQHCSAPMIFLLQLYAPFEDNPDAFHRHVFVFMCKDPKCHAPELAPPFFVLRNQLCRANKFYPSNPPVEVESYKPELSVGNFASICRTCGCRGSMSCAGCKKVTYCSKEHQRSDWKYRHKAECKNDTFQRKIEIEEFETHPEVFPQWEVVMQEGIESSDDEGDSESDDDEDDEEASKNELSNLKQLDLEEKAGKMDPEELEKYATDPNPIKDSELKKFLKIVKKIPGQVVRYFRQGEPLWVSETNYLSSLEVPKCEYCEGPRNFEFQIMPQLLAHLKLDALHLDSIDWGTLVIYTCSKSCSPTSGSTYKKEFLWRQFMPSLQTNWGLGVAGDDLLFTQATFTGINPATALNIVCN